MPCDAPVIIATICSEDKCVLLKLSTCSATYPRGAPATRPARPAGLNPESAGARRGVPATGSAFRRRGEVGEVVEELRGLGEAGDEVLIEYDLGGVVERVLGQALPVVAALPGV